MYAERWRRHMDNEVRIAGPKYVYRRVAQARGYQSVGSRAEMYEGVAAGT